MSKVDVNTSVEINGVKYIPADSVSPEVNHSDDDYVIVRSRDQGVMCGYLKSINGRQVEISQCRQLWSWNGKALCLPDIQRYGIRGTARMSAVAPSAIFLEACGVLRCTPEAAKSLREHDPDKYSQ
jgi:hypothetical protein